MDKFNINLAADILYNSRINIKRIKELPKECTPKTIEEAYAMGLADILVPKNEVRGAARQLAEEIAENSPLGVLETRATMRRGLVERVRAATTRELEIQNRLKSTADFKEGVKAMAERRIPNFVGS